MEMSSEKEEEGAEYAEDKTETEMGFTIDAKFEIDLNNALDRRDTAKNTLESAQRNYDAANDEVVRLMVERNSEVVAAKERLLGRIKQLESRLDMASP